MIVKVEIPESYTDSSLIEYEWLLEWYSGYGTPAYYLFTDWESKEKVNTTVINKTSDSIKTLINSEDRTVVLIAEDIPKENIPGFRSLQKAKNIARLNTDGTRERVAILNSTLTHVQSKQRYVFEITLQRRQSDLII